MKNANLPIKILIIDYDWRNIYENNFSLLIDKLERDGLNPRFNKFLLISWSQRGYYKKVGNIATAHLKYAFFRFRFIYDFFSVFITPFILIKVKFKPDIVLIYDFPLVFSGLFPKLFYKSKIFLFIEGLPAEIAKIRSFSEFRRIYQHLSEFFGKYLVDYFVVISDATKNYIIKLNIEPGKIKKINLNIITEKDKKFILSSNKGRIRKLYNIPDSKKIFFSAGRLEPGKGFVKLFNVFKSLGRDDLILIIAGDGVLKRNLTDMATKMNIEKSVIFVGYVDRKEIWDYYNDADMFILLSQSEGLGIVFLEAMYVGVPVMGSRIPGIMESIGNDGERGYYWDECNGVDKIQKILKNDNNIIKMRNRAKLYIKHKIEFNNSINNIKYE